MLASTVPAVSYIVAPSSNSREIVDELARRLGGRFDVAPGQRGSTRGSKTVTATHVVLDTADRRLRAAELELVCEKPGDGDRLMLYGSTLAPPLTAPTGRGLTTRSGRGWFVDDLPRGALRDRLAPIVGVRALLPIVELRRRTAPLDVRNRDGKTVVRLALGELSAAKPGNDEVVRMETRLDARGVLGYSKAFSKLSDAMSSLPDLDLAASSVVDEAVMTLGLDPEGVARKPRTPLQPVQHAGRAALAVLSAQAAVVEANLAGVLGDLDTEFLHDLRVAVRRSRSVLRQLEPVFPADARGAQADNLRWVQAITGATRDLDVQLLEWQQLVGALSPQRHRDVMLVHDLLRARRAQEFRAMKRTLRSVAFERRWSSWRSFLADERGEVCEAISDPISGVAGRRIRKVYRRMVREGAVIDDSSPATALHDLRKRGKELRYLLELFGDLWPQSVVKPLVARLKDLQEVLGRHQDREVQADNLRSLAPDLSGVAGGGEALLALGSVIDRLEVEQRQARAAFVRRFEAFAAPKRAKELDATFRRSTRTRERSR